MKYVIPILLLLFVACSDDENQPTGTGGDPPSQGTTRTFNTNPGNNWDCCRAAIEASKSNADIYCINLGYEYATRWTTFDRCECVANTYGPYLLEVTCWKP